MPGMGKYRFESNGDHGKQEMAKDDSDATGASSTRYCHQIGIVED
jgi:hypothetical protein